MGSGPGVFSTVQWIHCNEWAMGRFWRRPRYRSIPKLAYDISWYGAGAVHPNSHFETYNFSLPERLILLSLDDFFNDYDAAVQRISELCIAELCREYWRRLNEKPDEHQINWFNEGAGAKAENFTKFTVSADHFTFLFAPYKVSAYACGTWSVDVSFYDLIDNLKSEGPHLLAAQRSYS
jgi:hypothetical protein